MPRPSRLHSRSGESVLALARRGTGVWASGCQGLLAVDADPPTGWGDWAQFRCPLVWGDGAGQVLLFGARRPNTPLAVLRYVEAGPPELVASLSPEHPDRFSAPSEGPWFVFEDQVYAVPPAGPAVPLVAAGELGATDVVALHGPPAPGVDATARAVWLLLDGRRLVLWRAGAILRELRLPGRAPARDLLVRGDRTWVSTYGAGLLALRGDRVEATLTTAEGLCDDALSRLFDPGDGRIWLNTNRGLGWVEESDLEDVVAGRSERLHCTLTTTEEANGRAGLLGTDGRIWAPTTDGVTELDPTRVIDVPPPPLMLESATYQGHDLRAGTGGAIPVVRGPGLLAVRFVALDFDRPVDVQYRYRVQGPTDPESGWSEPTRSRELHFGPLGPGEYVFQVQAHATGTPWSEPVELHFVRRPLLSETAWVRLGVPLGLVGALVLGLVGGWARDRRARVILQLEIAERERAEQGLVREREERARAQRELEASRRLQAVGRLAAGIAHDFNNLLVVVASHATLLAEHGDAEVRESADELTDLVKRASEVVNGLLVVGQQGPHAPVLLELGASLEGLMPFLDRMIRDNVVISLNQEARVWVRIDPGRLHQVVTNLVLNARDAIEGDGRIGLTVLEGANGEGPCAELWVEDTGVGMGEEQLARAFEPYFTTKTASQGTGLGLATVHGAVAEAGGRVDIQSDVGTGTRVIVHFPLVRSEPITTPRATPSSPTRPVAARRRAGRKLHVLIVDDHAYLLRAVSRMIGRLGWTCRTATGLEEAVERALQESFDLLLSDVVMPGADGPAVYAAVRAVQPGLPVLFMTGYADGVLGDSLGTQLVLRKPFGEAELAQAVELALSEQETPATPE